jgi:hypothetical protein
MSEEKNIPHESNNVQAASDKDDELASRRLSGGNRQSSTQQQTTNDKPETPTMEVHKHPHHVTHKKEWGEYLLEFVMIFLAIFLGFIAENYRESQVERKHANQYALQLLNDLRVDSAQLQNNMKLNLMFVGKMDTLRKLVHAFGSKNFTTGQLYYYGRYTTWYNRFVPNDATLQQMKSSGSIRYFKNSLLEQRISQYDKMVRQLMFHESGEYAGINDMWLLNSQIFDGSILDSVNNVELPREYYTAFMSNNYPLVTNDPTLLVRLANLCRSRQLWIRYKIDESYMPAFRAVTALISLLRKEYHLQ